MSARPKGSRTGSASSKSKGKAPEKGTLFTFWSKPPRTRTEIIEIGSSPPASQQHAGPSVAPPDAQISDHGALHAGKTENGGRIPLFLPESDDDELDNDVRWEYDDDIWDAVEGPYDEPNGLADEDTVIVIDDDDDEPDSAVAPCPICGKDLSALKVSILSVVLGSSVTLLVGYTVTRQSMSRLACPSHQRRFSVFEEETKAEFDSFAFCFCLQASQNINCLCSLFTRSARWSSR
jgi:hypothetical protein